MSISKAIIDAGTMGALGNKPENGTIAFMPKAWTQGKKTVLCKWYIDAALLLCRYYGGLSCFFVIGCCFHKIRH